MESIDPAADAVGEDVVADVRRSVTRLARRLRAQRPAGGVSGNKLSVLAHLSTYGPSSPKEVAAAERQRPQSLTRVLAELENDALVQRTPNENDFRSSILAITERGTELLRADMAGRDAWLAEAMSGLSELEVQILHLSTKIMDRIA